MKKEFIGEITGTFLMVFFGLSSVASAVTGSGLDSLFSVACVWGLGLIIAIYVSAPLSGAHLNPAISIAFATFTDFPAKKLPAYFCAQFIGAFLSAAVVFILFGAKIVDTENLLGLVRGENGSEASAMIFGEFFPNLGGKPLSVASKDYFFNAFFAEFLGTLLLTLGIFSFTQRKTSPVISALIPVLIGVLLTLLIIIFAPFSQAGFNPARDLAPRVFSSLAGWKSIPFTANGIGWFWVYLIAPIVGSVSGGALWKVIKH